MALVVLVFSKKWVAKANNNINNHIIPLQPQTTLNVEKNITISTKRTITEAK